MKSMYRKAALCTVTAGPLSLVVLAAKMYYGSKTGMHYG